MHLKVCALKHLRFAMQVGAEHACRLRRDALGAERRADAASAAWWEPPYSRVENNRVVVHTHCRPRPAMLLA